MANKRGISGAFRPNAAPQSGPRRATVFDCFALATLPGGPDAATARAWCAAGDLVFLAEDRGQAVACLRAKAGVVTCLLVLRPRQGLGRALLAAADRAVPDTVPELRLAVADLPEGFARACGFAADPAAPGQWVRRLLRAPDTA